MCSTRSAGLRQIVGGQSLATNDIRIAFGLAVIGCALSIILKLAWRVLPAGKPYFDGAATVLILGLVSAMSLYIFVKMLAGAKRSLPPKKAQVSVAG